MSGILKMIRLKQLLLGLSQLRIGRRGGHPLPCENWHKKDISCFLASPTQVLDPLLEFRNNHIILVSSWHLHGVDDPFAFAHRCLGSSRDLITKNLILTWYASVVDLHVVSINPAVHEKWIRHIHRTNISSHTVLM